MSLNIPYPDLDFVPLDVLSAEEMNQIVANYTYISNQFPVTSSNIDWTVSKVISTTQNLCYYQEFGSILVTMLNIRSGSIAGWASLDTGLTIPAKFRPSGNEHFVVNYKGSGSNMGDQPLIGLIAPTGKVYVSNQSSNTANIQLLAGHFTLMAN